MKHFHVLSNSSLSQLQNSSARKIDLFDHIESLSPRLPFWAGHRLCRSARQAWPLDMIKKPRFFAAVDFCNWLCARECVAPKYQRKVAKKQSRKDQKK